ncbi:hypothetical protein [Streptomyces beigongshangae]|uniref:hypothetical protein n=1 Tax=Streptomyces beigongshangae TaxID=2841597 RepID=UPI001C84F1FF|nr:hypothetical protein [Streptomyces sp. REN17]
MNDRAAQQPQPQQQPQSLIATPDGEAELAVVLRLSWEDVAVLGQEAGRLAASMQRPVTLDEAASHRLRGRRTGSHAGPAASPPAAVAPAVGGPQVSAVSALSRTPGEQARQAIEKINGNAQGA